MRKPFLILTLLISSLAFLFILSLPDRNLNLVFCDVGQGDAILVNYGTTQILVDGGPDSKVVSCLSRHMPFWDRKIEVVILTHPQEDHYGGLVDVVRRYKVENFIRPDVEGTSIGWEVLKEELTKHPTVVVHFVNSGESIRYSNLHFDILNPSQGFVGSDLNEYSVVGNLSFGEFDALLTGDVVPPVTDELASRITQEVEILKVPHHGSKNGLTNDLLEAANPKLAVISVGKNNRYGHPHEETLKILRDKDIKILRTDEDGEVEIISDGKGWWVRNRK